MIIVTGMVLADLDVSLSAAQADRGPIASVAGAICAGLVVPFLARPAYRAANEHSGVNFMTTNVGTIDRILRIIVGAALIAWALGFLPGIAPSPWGWIGVVPLLTAVVGYCPAYSILGMSTCSKRA